MMLNPELQNAKEGQFFSLLYRYETFAKAAGKPVFRSKTEEGLRLWQALEENTQANTLARLESEVSILEIMLKEGESLSSCSQQLWRFFAKTKLTPSSDLFDKISSSDTIQVYSLESTLLFISLNFLEHVSFTLEQIFCEPWHRATKRDSRHQEVLSKAIEKIVSGEVTHTFDPENEWHPVQELNTQMLLQYQIKVKWVSPYFSEQQLAGYIGVVGTSLTLQD